MQLYQPNHPVLSIETVHLRTLYIVTLQPWGLAPIPPASTLSQKQEDFKTYRKKTGLKKEATENPSDF